MPSERIPQLSKLSKGKCYATLFLILASRAVTIDHVQVKGVKDSLPWWRHQMETFSALLAICAGNSPVPVNSPHKGQWRGALMFSLICERINSWVNNGEAGGLRRHRGHYDVIVMITLILYCTHLFVCILYYSDVIMSVMGSQITIVSSVYSTVCSGVDQRNHQSSASLAFVKGINRENSLHKGPVTQKIFPFDDVIISLVCREISSTILNDAIL